MSMLRTPPNGRNDGKNDEELEKGPQTFEKNATGPTGPQNIPQAPNPPRGILKNPSPIPNPDLGEGNPGVNTKEDTEKVRKVNKTGRNSGGTSRRSSIGENKEKEEKVEEIEGKKSQETPWKKGGKGK